MVAQNVGQLLICRGAPLVVPFFGRERPVRAGLERHHMGESSAVLGPGDTSGGWAWNLVERTVASCAHSQHSQWTAQRTATVDEAGSERQLQQILPTRWGLYSAGTRKLAHFCPSKPSKKSSRQQRRSHGTEKNRYIPPEPLFLRRHASKHLVLRAFTPSQTPTRGIDSLCPQSLH